MEAREMSGKNLEQQSLEVWHPLAIRPDGEISTGGNGNSFEHLRRINGQMFRKGKAQRLVLDTAELEIRDLPHCTRHPERNPHHHFH